MTQSPSEDHRRWKGEARSSFPRWSILLAALFLFGLALRLYRIDYQSVWFDEAFSIMTSRLSVAELTAELVRDFVHPPLRHYVLKGWFILWGPGALQARLLSALFGSFAIVVIYVLAGYLFDRRTRFFPPCCFRYLNWGLCTRKRPGPTRNFFFLSYVRFYSASGRSGTDGPSIGVALFCAPRS